LPPRPTSLSYRLNKVYGVIARHGKMAPLEATSRRVGSVRP
jgi:hypothetical protein